MRERAGETHLRGPVREVYGDFAGRDEVYLRLIVVVLFILFVEVTDTARPTSAQGAKQVTSR